MQKAVQFAFLLFLFSSLAYGQEDFDVDEPDGAGFEEHHAISSFSSSKQERRLEEDEHGNMVPVVDNKEETSKHSRDHQSRKFLVKDGQKEFFDVKSSHESGTGPLGHEEMQEFERESKKLEKQFDQERAKLERKLAEAREKLERKFKHFEKSFKLKR